MSRPFRNIITIQFSNPIGWSLVRLFKSTQGNIIFNVENIKELENINLTTDGTIVLLFFKDRKYFHKWYWENIARKYNSLSPVLTFGFADTEKIRYKNRLFANQRNNFEYIQLPCSTTKLLECFNKLDPINDFDTLNRIDQHCSDDKAQIHGYAHDLKNKLLNISDPITEEEIKIIIDSFDQIIYDWDNAGIIKIKKEDVIFEKECFTQNKQWKPTYTFIENIYKITK